MPLIKCRDCGAEVSDSAAACPKCACPVTPAKPAKEPQTAKKTFFGVIRILVVTVLLIVIAAAALQLFVSSKGHPEAGPLATITETWNDRAIRAFNGLLERQPQTFADTIQGLTHPTGKNARLTNYSIRQSGDHLTARFDVEWQGGLTGDKYTTAVAWEFSEQGHIRASLIGDNATIAADAAHLQKLDNYFRGEAYPVLFSNAR